MIDRDFVEKIEELTSLSPATVLDTAAGQVVVSTKGENHVLTTMGELRTVEFLETQKRTLTPNVFGIETLPSFIQAVPAILRAEQYQRSEELSGVPVAIHVESPTRVSAVRLDPDVFSRRRVLAVCDCTKVTPPVDFAGKWMTSEQMNILLQTSFEDDTLSSVDRADLLKMVGTLVEQQIIATKDDGVSQVVETRTELSINREVAPRLVSLAPYRTFRNLAQPASPFLLRVKAGRDKPGCPELALFETDGGRWRLAAMQAIATFLLPSCVEHGFTLLV